MRRDEERGRGSGVLEEAGIGYGLAGLGLLFLVAR